VRDWAGVSPPQVYYSLDKLARLRLIQTKESDEPAAGPDRRVFATTAEGRTALADALERDHWTCGRDRPPLLTWMALSWRARPGVFEAQLRRRRAFLTRELARGRATLRGVRAEVGHPYHEAVWMLTLMIDQLTAELRWLKGVERQANRRAPARRPKFVTGSPQSARARTPRARLRDRAPSPDSHRVQAASERAE